MGDDWSEDHHDVEVVDESGRRLARRRLPEGIKGIAALHALLADFLPEEWVDSQTGLVAQEVAVGIETDRGPWVQALLAAGYRVFAINPLQSARYRERHSTSGAKSDPGDAHVLAEIVRLDREHHREVAADSVEAEALKLLARTHQTLIWERQRHVLRLRSALREFFPAALEAFEDLTAPEALELLGRAPDPMQAAKLSKATISAALKRANRRGLALAGPQPVQLRADGDLLPARAEALADELQRRRAPATGGTRPYASGWQATGDVTIEPGEELSRVAADVKTLVGG